MKKTYILVLGLILLLAPGTRSAILLEDILSNMAENSVMQEGRMRFQQRIEMRAFLFSWRFSADVEKEGEQVTVVVSKGAPSFVPDDMPAELIDIQSSFHLFDLAMVGEEPLADGHVLYIVEGQRKEASSYGVQSGKLWIDSRDWYIAQAHMAYTWGRLEVQQEYRIEQGRRVLHRQTAVARPLGARVEVDYVEYWFEDS